jgi:flagellar biosynthetic protein FlhB
MAENEDGQERSESPTARRRQMAEEEGKVARSADLSSVAVLLAGAAFLAMVGGSSLASFSRRVLAESAGALSTGALTPTGAAHALQTIALGLVQALLPFLLGVVAVTVFVNLVQSRGRMSAKAIQPRLSKLNPTAGLKRLVSLDSVANLVKSLLKLAALATISWLVLRRSWPEMISLAETGPATVMVVLRTLGLRLVFFTGIAFLVVALADYAWQLWRNEQSLKMSKQEVMLEHKETEGDPQIKGRIRQIQRQRARQRMLQAVPRADVVITNPTHVAVALRYDPSEASAPVVLAMGERKLAERIKQIARDANVPLVENKPIARALLATCTVDKPIPPALYTAVAEILAFVYRLRNPRYAREPGRAAA